MISPRQNFLVRFCMAAALLAVCGNAFAQEPDSNSVARAKDFLGSDARARHVMGYCHFGATYQGQSYVGQVDVLKNGNKVPGHFALVYDYSWEPKGSTRLAYLCNAQGRVYTVQLVKSNAFLQQPFAVANLSIQVLGNVLLDAFRKQLNENDAKAVQRMIDAADSKGLLETSLILQQAFGR